MTHDTRGERTGGEAILVLLPSHLFRPARCGWEADGVDASFAETHRAIDLLQFVLFSCGGEMRILG
jgi:hypothetical protein